MKKFFELINKNLDFSRMSQLIKNPLGKKLHPLIVISREKGSGGRPIAYLVAKKLGKPWEVYHKEIVDQIAQETHLEKKLIKEIDEKRISFIESIIADVFGKKYVTLSNYYKHLLRILSTIGNRGYAIIVGRGANFLFPDALKVRTICPMEQRIKWMMEYEKLNRKQAIERIEKSDAERSDFVKIVYNHDQRKAHHYDLIIRTGPQISIEDAADIIVRMAKRRFKI